LAAPRRATSAFVISTGTPCGFPRGSDLGRDAVRQGAVPAHRDQGRSHERRGESAAGPGIPSPAPGGRRLMQALLIVLVMLAAFPAAAQLRIGDATMLPGEIFFERFGHNAIVVDDPAFAEPVSYNFGYFDMDEPDFVGRFVRGDMRYRLVALPLSQDLAYYREVGRRVSIQWLDLDPAQARSLAAAIEENARPENAVYR